MTTESFSLNAAEEVIEVAAAFALVRNDFSGDIVAAATGEDCVEIEREKKLWRQKRGDSGNLIQMIKSTSEGAYIVVDPS